MSETEKTQQASTRATDKRRASPEGEAREEGEASTAEPTPEQEASAGAPPERSEVVQLRAELEAARKRVDDLARAFQALDRDREDFKQRLNRERERMIEVEKGNVAVNLIEAVDELDRSLQAAGDEDTPLAKGVRMIRDNLLRKLEGAGVERVSLVGGSFDPDTAEAVDMEMTTDPAEDQRVVAEVRPAYRMKDRLIRPGRVKVAKFVKPANA